MRIGKMSIGCRLLFLTSWTDPSASQDQLTGMFPRRCAWPSAFFQTAPSSSSCQDSRYHQMPVQGEIPRTIKALPSRCLGSGSRLTMHTLSSNNKNLNLESTRGVQPFGVSGPRMKYIATRNHKKISVFLSKSTILCWVTFTAALSHLRPVGYTMGHPRSC